MNMPAFMEAARHFLGGVSADMPKEVRERHGAVLVDMFQLMRHQIESGNLPPPAAARIAFALCFRMIDNALFEVARLEKELEEAKAQHAAKGAES